ncbi:hypothetical protein NliqN6_2364 [Naganishia liquefaciens]|uniref:Uncharacterized protein n=1 Tax=Naganishia liquefaciens TaxID=104408 RepID=A0A8H3YF76_9TREE|nr:hypothetical protein NliqN6_2364 [Naganishia liquefaciens]
MPQTKASKKKFHIAAIVLTLAAWGCYVALTFFGTNLDASVKTHLSHSNLYLFRVNGTEITTAPGKEYYFSWIGFCSQDDATMLGGQRTVPPPRSLGVYLSRVSLLIPASKPPCTLAALHAILSQGSSAALFITVLLIMQCSTFYASRKEPLSAKSGKQYILWSIVIVLLALTTAITLVAMVDTAINQLQSSMNAYVTAGYYRGASAYACLFIAAICMPFSLVCWKKGRFEDESEDAEKNRRRF